MIRLTLHELDVRSGKRPTDPYTVHMPSGDLVAVCGTLDEAIRLVAFFRTMCDLVRQD